ncbi:2OG-Fe(II) oxygenase [Pseudomonas luteola]|uniref:2OG-Fe(II) oxygenase n=1 Tax=Pseudomonas luteola TaxID=47886 RepID=UPI001EF6165F|nr:2OG-Fe(II) oxygenase [Pseudomonas luteola]MCG7374145.1 2OG-Fe(II) oxygenase [Pseudomonas luteola]
MNSYSDTQLTTCSIMPKLNWDGIREELCLEGYAVIKNFLDEDASNYLSNLEAHNSINRDMFFELDLGKQNLMIDLPVQMKPLDNIIKDMYNHLRPTVQLWSEQLNSQVLNQHSLDDISETELKNGPKNILARISHLKSNDFIALHQHPDKDLIFPLQIEILLSTPGKDFTGGEFIMIEQRPRMQSRPIVVQLGFKDAVVFSASKRPVLGSKHVYQVNMRHAISRIISGERKGLEISFYNDD